MNYPKHRTGFTLVEVMIATAIFTVVGFGIISLSVHLRRLAENNVYQAMAYTIAQGYLEQLNSMAWFELMDLDKDGNWVPQEPIATVSGIDGHEDDPLPFYVLTRDLWPEDDNGDPDPFQVFPFADFNDLSDEDFDEMSIDLARSTGRNLRRYKVVASAVSDGTDGVVSAGREMRMVFTPEIIPLPNHEDHGLIIHLHVIYEVPSTSKAMHQESFTSSIIRTRYNSF